MNFNDWQIDKLRRGLQSYRLLKSQNGRLVSWRDVVDALLLSPATQMEYPASGEEAAIPLKEEALRRFAAGQSTLQPDKLGDVMRFLIDARVLTKEEMADDGQSVRDATAVRAVLANVTSAGVSRLELLASAYRSKASGDAAHEALEIRVVSRPDSSLIYVEEQCRVRSGEVPALPHKDRAAASFVRKGFGIAVSAQAVLNLFLRGPGQDDLVHYVELPSPSSRIPERDNVMLLRFGPEARAQEGVRSNRGSDASQALKPIHFTAADATPVTPKAMRFLTSGTKMQ